MKFILIITVFIISSVNAYAFPIGHWAGKQVYTFFFSIGSGEIIPQNVYCDLEVKVTENQISNRASNCSGDFDYPGGVHSYTKSETTVFKGTHMIGLVKDRSIELEHPWGIDTFAATYTLNEDRSISYEHTRRNSEEYENGRVYDHTTGQLMPVTSH